VVSPDAPAAGTDRGATRRLLTAELLSIGTELTVGETVDTNAGELARTLVAEGVRVVRVTALPDDLDVVANAIRDALGRADLVVTTGGLGPTPDDLTREAIALVCGEVPSPDPEVVAWLRGMWDRRGMPFPEGNIKQAWLIPSATVLPNPNGTAPGWVVDRPDGRVIVTLPGPPREMRPMWTDDALHRLRERGLGRSMVIRILRLTGIGESQVADQLGESLLRAANPIVATYARADAVDVRISAVDDGDRTAVELVDDTERIVLAAVGDHVWAHGSTSWPEAIAQALAGRAWTLATVERGCGGSVAALLGDLEALRRADVIGAHGAEDEADEADGLALAEGVRERSGADVALGVIARPRGSDTAVSVAVVTPSVTHRERRLAFQTGPQGRARAALTAAAILLEQLRRDPQA
jgi:nicotinamide-nucleotide amidase